MGGYKSCQKNQTGSLASARNRPLRVCEENKVNGFLEGLSGLQFNALYAWHGCKCGIWMCISPHTKPNRDKAVRERWGYIMERCAVLLRKIIDIKFSYSRIIYGDALHTKSAKNSSSYYGLHFHYAQRTQTHIKLSPLTNKLRWERSCTFTHISAAACKLEGLEDELLSCENGILIGYQRQNWFVLVSLPICYTLV